MLVDGFSILLGMTLNEGITAYLIHH